MSMPVRQATEPRTVGALRQDPAPPARQRRAVERALGLSDLMVRRPDLRGVYPPADVAAEAVRWSA